MYEQFVARVLESAHAAAESARRAENGAADTAMQAALAQKTADKILADRTDAEPAQSGRRLPHCGQKAMHHRWAGAEREQQGRRGAAERTGCGGGAKPGAAFARRGGAHSQRGCRHRRGADRYHPAAGLRPYVRSETVPTAATPGAVRADGQYGVAVRADATLTTVPATAAQLDRMTEAYAPLTPALLPYGVKRR